MNWTNALGLCPRCEGTFEEGQLVCLQCGLRFATTDLLRYTRVPTTATPPELDTTVLKPVQVTHKVESKLPAVLVICAVGALAVGMVLTSAHKNDNTARANSETPPVSATATTSERVTHITIPTRTVMSVREASLPTSTVPVLPTATSIPLPTFTSLTLPSVEDVPPAPEPPEAPSEEAVAPAKSLPGTGGFTGDFNGWWVKLDGIASRPVLWSTTPDTRHDPQGTFWVAYLVYRNESAQARTLGETLDFVLTDGDGNTYPELGAHSADPQLRKIAVAQDANPIDYTVVAGDRTTTVLVFDLPAGVKPASLVGRILQDGKALNVGQVVWVLGDVK